MNVQSWKGATAKPDRPRSEPAPRKAVPRTNGNRPSPYDRACAYVATMQGGIEGSGGSRDTMRAAIAAARGFALSEDDTFAVLSAYHNPKCEPPWSDKELAHKAKSAFASERVPLGYLLDADRSGSNEAHRGHGVPDDWRETPPDPESNPSEADAPPDPNPEPSEPSERSERAKTNTGRAAISITEVLTEWSQSGPLIHEPTGIPRLDELTGGGPVYGSRWYFPGAPDAGKTALLVQLAHSFALRGVAVGLLAVDEEAGDLVTRLAQRVGYSRAHCEVRDVRVLQEMDRELGELPLRFYDGTWTIEEAAADLATFAKLRAEQDPATHPNGPRAMLGVDSIQTVHCGADLIALAAGRELSEVSAVTARVRAVRAMASRHRLIAVVTSEFGRGAYRSPETSQQTATLAAAKWSGAIEYSARVMVGLRSVAGEQDLIELEIAKNKHGPRDEKLHLRIDRRSQTLVPTIYDAPPKATAADRDAKAKAKVSADTIAVAKVLLAWPGLGVREFRSKVKATEGIPHGRVDTALDGLGAAVIRGEGPNNATPLSLDLDALADEIRHVVEGAK